MNARPIDTEATNPSNETGLTPEEERETLGALVDLMGHLDGGYRGIDFEEEKKAILDSGVSLSDFLGIIGENAAEELTGRRIYDVPVQKLSDTAHFPTYANTSDACADIYSDEDITIQPGETHCVSTGLALAIPQGFVCHVYSRSGLSVKTSLRLANSVGVIDAGYRDELKIPIWNSGDTPYHIEKGMRIAQMDIRECPGMEFVEVEDIKSIKGDRLGGFGSSGLFDNDGVDE